MSKEVWGTYKVGIDYAKGYTMDSIKVMVTCIDNMVILDNPVDYVSVYQIDRRKFRNVKSDKRYQFEVSLAKSAKPQIISAVEIENENDNTRYNVILNARYISEYKQ